VTNIGHKKFVSIPDCIGVGDMLAVLGSVLGWGCLESCCVVSLVLSDCGYWMECCIKRISVEPDLRGWSTIVVVWDWCIAENVWLFLGGGGMMGIVAVLIGSAHGTLFRVGATRG